MVCGRIRGDRCGLGLGAMDGGMMASRFIETNCEKCGRSVAASREYAKTNTIECPACGGSPGFVHVLNPTPYEAFIAISEATQGKICDYQHGCLEVYLKTVEDRIDDLERTVAELKREAVK